MTPEIIGMATGVVLTLAIFSYLLGDNFLYRIALYIFIGALLGYTLGIMLLLGWNIIAVRLAGGEYALAFPLILGILLLFKGFPKYAYIGNFSLAFLIGVGTAVALSGALLGTLVPQIEATGRAVGNTGHLGRGLLIAAGTACTVLAFDFTITHKWRGLMGTGAGFIRLLGRIFLIFAYGIAFAGALTASLSIFIGRVQYIIEFLQKLGILSG